MREIVTELKKRYPDRYIFINAPSMKLSSEVQVLANVSDQVVFQLDSGTVDEQQVTEAVEMIGPEKVAGVVVFSGR
jgi:Mrp family chromosome partitioning ATPase